MKNLIKLHKRPSWYDRSNYLRSIFQAIIFSIVFLSIGLFYLRFSWNKYEKIAQKDASSLAESLGSMLHVEDIDTLTGNESDISKKEYNILKKNFMNLVHMTNPIHNAYLLKLNDDNITILIDAEDPSSSIYSPPGQVYEEAEQSYWESFQSNKTIITSPVKDRWGTWISILVPLIEPSNGEVQAVFGIDYSASEWNLRIWKQIIPDIIIVIALLFLFLALLYTRFQQSMLKWLSKKLQYDEALYHGVFNQAPIGIGIVDNKNFVIQSEYDDININSLFEKIIGRSKRELKNITWEDITHPDDLRADLDMFQKFKLGEIEGYSMEKRFLKPDKSSVWTKMTVSSLEGIPDGKDMHLCLLEDISLRKEAEDGLKESERNKSVLLSNLPGMAYRCLYDKDWTMQFVSDGCYTLTGYKPESLLNNKELSYNDIITPNYRDLLWNEWKYILSNKLPFKYEYEITTASGDTKWVLEMGEGIYDSSDEVIALEGIILDITDKKIVEDKLRHIVEHDPWTNLYNRRNLERILQQDSINKLNEKTALVGINLNTMYSLSLTYGFSYSQNLLKKVADILQYYCNDNIDLYSTYEYRFVFYVKNYLDSQELLGFCQDVSTAIMSIISNERIGGGIGVIEIDEINRLDIEQLLKNLLVTTEIAMKADINSLSILFFDNEMAEKINRDDYISHELVEIVEGIDSSRLFLQYQPILDIKTNKISGFEALCRLKSNKYGRISPLDFIPLAEKTKLIIQLGEMITYKALGFIKELEKNGYKDIGVSVNASSIQLLSENFIKHLSDTIKSLDINPYSIGVELTESIFMDNYDDINKVLGTLKSMGIRIAIDDFGTGYSSLAREREINANCLKIDKFFFDKLMYLSTDETITSDIISMGHKLGHCVIAEGVEHEKQLDYLKAHGCDKAQGYFISKPADEDIAFEVLKKYNGTKTINSNLNSIDPEESSCES